MSNPAHFVGVEGHFLLVSLPMGWRIIQGHLNDII